MKFKYYFTIAKLLLLVSLPVVLIILPGNFFDDGPPMCLSVIFFDVECYGCGLTRACQHLIHFQFEDAYAYNVLSFAAFPALAIFWLQWFLKEVRIYKKLRINMMAIDSIL
jgi:hypothetical protein